MVNIYVGSTSMTLTKRLVLHRSRANTLKKGYEDTKLYVRMREVGVEKLGGASPVGVDV